MTRVKENLITLAAHEGSPDSGASSGIRTCLARMMHKVSTAATKSSALPGEFALSGRRLRCFVTRTCKESGLGKVESHL